MTHGWRGAAAPDRSVLRVEGADAESFLQGLLTNNVARAAPGAPVYAALLTPQGKFLCDMILWRPGAPERFLLDVPSALSPDLLRRLTLYKLRAAVSLAEEPALGVLLLWAEEAPSRAPEMPAGALDAAPDPREAGLGWRVLGPREAAPPAPGPWEEWDARRIALGVPAAGADLRPEDGYILEYGFERLRGVDFRKGCFVGQEVVARMKHKTELKKALFEVRVSGPVPPPGTEILSDGKSAGALGGARDGRALALLRLDRADGDLTAGEARLEAPRRIGA